MKRLILLLTMLGMFAVACEEGTIDQPVNGGDDKDEIVIPHNNIWYTTSYDTQIELIVTEGFGGNLISHTFEDGYGKIVFDNNVTAIPNEAFKDCATLTSILLPNCVTTIGDYAFEGCSDLTSATIPDNVTSIGTYAFAGCINITSVTIPESMESISGCAFLGCTKLIEFKGKYASEDGYCLVVDGVLNSFAMGCGVTNYTIPDNVITIGEHTFSYYTSFTDVTIGDSVTAIGDYAFANCGTLSRLHCKATTPPNLGSDVFSNTIIETIYVPKESVELYKSTSAWSDYADCIFSGTPNNNEIWYTSLDSNIVEPSYEWGGNALTIFGANIVSNTYENGKGIIKFDGDVTMIGNCAFFYSCERLTTITIPDSVTTIGDYAFNGCTSLKTLRIPDSVTTIGDYAFSGCTSLKTLRIPDSVTTIGDCAFGGCLSLTSVTIPDSITTISDSAFRRCLSLTSVTFGDSVTTIGDYAFYECSSLTSITIPDSVKTIGEHAFGGCLSLTSVTIGDGVTTIGNYAFESCDSLTSVTIGDSVTTIGEWAFAWCENLTSVTMGNSVTTIGDQAFRECRSLTSVTIPDSATTIGIYAFLFCESLTSVTIGKSVTTIGDDAFRFCSSLTTVYCKPTTPPNTGMGLRVFYDTNIETIYVPTDSVEAYRTVSRWRVYYKYIVGYDF